MPSPSLPHVPSERDRAARVMVIIMHALYLLSIPLPFLTLVIGVVLAYASRAEAPDPWRSHFDEAIRTFWIYVLLMLIGIPLWFVLFLGVIPMAAALVLLVFRSVRGLIRAVNWAGVE
ncbi:DUF4870 family protein [Roseospira navarrensis]|uniref:DUF4870 domain-containing protein n=1 Tax=Roseospira navarrensis TaxID=140058 RepID=A0A7X2D5D8_9PROT|nr:hypothetical protein [Roseospira navarrensis]MQX37582.1 hypothetical protein [Roseospira navarrensis]